MVWILLICVVICIIAYFAYTFIQENINSVYIKSEIDSRFYKVRNNKNAKASADTLAVINKKVGRLLSVLKNEPYTPNIDLLLKRYNPSGLQENILQKNTTYTINKGESVSVCLSTRNTEETLYDINLLMFVIIHEMAHIGSFSLGHTPEFIRFFKYLLRVAIREKIWIYEDYRDTPKEYCGINVNSTPI